MNEIERQYVTVDGLRVGYLLRGSGPSVLLIHGLGEFLETWAYNIDSLSKHFTVCAVDLPGHGHSEQSKGDYTIDYCVGFVVDFMEVMGIKHVSLVGRSMGGPICLMIGIDFPDKVNKIILVSSGGFDENVPLAYRLALLPVLGDIMLGPAVLVNSSTVRLAMRRQFYNSNSVPDEWIQVACEYLKLSNRNETIRNIIRSNASLTSKKPKEKAIVTDKISLLNTPTLIVHGMQDNLVSVEQARDAASIIPDAQLKLLAECGHNPQIEKAPEFNELVLSFLKTN